MAGERGVQLTWMDAKVGEWVVTPRAGKPVEIQALWLNALWIASQHNDRWKEPLQRGLDSFQARFWNAERKMLYDVIDVNHRPGTVDASFRPNQILAVGGLPLRLIEDNRAFLIVQAVKDHLWTPLGLRSLAPGEPGYAPRYQGGVHERDGAYHQGTVWPWLLGAFVDAWVWIHQATPAAIHEARREYLRPLLDHLEHAGLGHISEIADAEAPHTPRVVRGKRGRWARRCGSTASCSQKMQSHTDLDLSAVECWNQHWPNRGFRALDTSCRAA